MPVQATYIRAPWRCELREIELAEPPPGWLRVAVEACGVCGTDLTAAQRADDWQPVGHEVAGRIEACGAAVDHLQPGQRVVLESASFCGRCEACRNGRVDRCRGGAANFWGQPSLGMAGAMLAPACCAVPYEGLEPDVASLAEPCGVAYDLVQTAGVALGDRVLVIGPGPIGLAAAALARAVGARQLTVIGTARSCGRLAIAEGLGARGMVSAAPDFADCAELDARFDHVLNTAPVECLGAALRFLDLGGIQSYVGFGSGSGLVSFDANDFHLRKLQLRASYASPALYMPVVLELLREGIIPGDQLISHRFPLQDAAAAFELCRDRKGETCKVVITL